MYAIIERRGKYGETQWFLTRGHSKEEIQNWFENFADNYPDSPRYLPATIVSVTDVRPTNIITQYRWVAVSNPTIPLNIQAYRIWQNMLFDYVSMDDQIESEWASSSDNDPMELVRWLLENDTIMRKALNIPSSEPALNVFKQFNLTI